MKPIKAEETDSFPGEKMTYCSGIRALRDRTKRDWLMADGGRREEGESELPRKRKNYDFSWNLGTYRYHLYPGNIANQGGPA